MSREDFGKDRRVVEVDEANTVWPPLGVEVEGVDEVCTRGLYVPVLVDKVKVRELGVREHGGEDGNISFVHHTVLVAVAFVVTIGSQLLDDATSRPLAEERAGAAVID